MIVQPDMADKPPEKTLNALLLEGETTLRDIRGKQARVAELDGRVLSAASGWRHSF